MLRGVFFRPEWPLLSAAGRGLPGGNSLSLASPRESKQREGDPTCCVPSLRYGQPAVLGPDGVSLNSLRSNNAIPDPSGPALLGASRRGGEMEYQYRIPKQPNSQQPKTEPRIPEETRTRHGESLLVLDLVLVFVPAPDPDCPLWMCRGAQGQTDQGKNLFERSELFLTPAGPSTAGCPGAKRRGRRNQGRLSFAYFSLAKQRKVSCRRATPGQPPPTKTPATRATTAKSPSGQQETPC